MKSENMEIMKCIEVSTIVYEEQSGIRMNITTIIVMKISQKEVIRDLSIVLGYTM